MIGKTNAGLFAKPTNRGWSIFPAVSKAFLSI